MLHLRYGGDAPVRNVLIYGSEAASIGGDEHAPTAASGSPRTAIWT